MVCGRRRSTAVDGAARRIGLQRRANAGGVATFVREILRQIGTLGAIGLLAAALAVTLASSPALADTEVLEREGFPLHDALRDGCLTGDPAEARHSGTFQPVRGAFESSGEGPQVITYRVEVEEGLPVDADCFATLVDHVLGHENGWGRSGRFVFRRMADGPVSARITLAAPPTVNRMCRPLRTNSFFSCWNGGRAMINFRQWSGRGRFRGEDLRLYRAYLINHEVGHRLGFGHRGCPGRSHKAPVMMQQTKTLGRCVLNAWPTAAELPGG